jgi:hypothetical protein
MVRLAFMIFENESHTFEIPRVNHLRYFGDILKVIFNINIFNIFEVFRCNSNPPPNIISVLGCHQKNFSSTSRYYWLISLTRNFGKECEFGASKIVGKRLHLEFYVGPLKVFLISVVFSKQ